MVQKGLGMDVLALQLRFNTRTEPSKVFIVTTPDMSSPIPLKP